MDTGENGKKTSQYIILIPHKDILIEVEKYRQRLFSKGFYGAHSFPLCAPLASISRPFSRTELKELAVNIRKKSMENEGKILTAENIQYGSGMIGSSGELLFFGLKLNIDNTCISQSAPAEKLLSVYNPPLICTALDYANKEGEQIPSLSFRAACVANLSIRPLFGLELSFEWNISPPVWLPSVKT